MSLEFTGEFMVPGKSPAHLEDDHLERYRFARRFAEGRRVLDIACGAGYGSMMLAESGARAVVGVDLNPEVVAYAGEHYRADNLRFVQGDVCAFGDDGAFDLATCFETIEHVPDHLAALANLRRVIEPGGILVVSSPNRPITSPGAATVDDRPANPFHVREFTVAELAADLRDAGFAVGEEDVFGQRHQLHFGNTLLRKIYKTLRRPYLNCSPVVTPAGGRHPEYFLLVGRRI